MENLTMTKEELKQVVKKYKFDFFTAEDVENAFNVVWDILTLEADALKKREPYATRTIDDLESAAFEVYNIRDDICSVWEEIREEVKCKK